MFCFAFFLKVGFSGQQWKYHGTKIQTSEGANGIKFHLSETEDFNEINLYFFNSTNGKLILDGNLQNDSCSLSFIKHPEADQFSSSCISQRNSTVILLYKPKNVFALSITKGKQIKFISIEVSPSFFQSQFVTKLSYCIFPLFCIVITFLAARQLGFYFDLIPDS